METTQIAEAAGRLYWAFGVILLLAFLSGWRQGVAREVVTLMGLIGSALLAIRMAPEFAIWVGALSGIPGLLLILPVGLAIFALGTFAGWLLSRLLIKRTANHGSGILRFIFGAGGGLISMAVTSLLMLILLMTVRMAGKAAEQRLVMDPAASQNRVWVGMDRAGRVVGSSAAAPLLELMDPLTQNYTETLLAIFRLTASPDSLANFAKHPAIFEVMANSGLAEAFQDETLVLLVEKKDFLGIIRHPSMRRALNNPRFVSALKEIDLKTLLEDLRRDGAILPPEAQ